MTPRARKAEMARARIALAEATRRLAMLCSDPQLPELELEELKEARQQAASAHLSVVRWIMEKEVDEPPDEG